METPSVIVFKILAHFGQGLRYYTRRQNMCVCVSLCCWSWFQFSMHAEDHGSLLFLIFCPLINSVSLSPNKQTFIILHSRLVWKSFIQDHGFLFFYSFYFKSGISIVT